MPASSVPVTRTVHWLWPLLLLMGSVTLTIAWVMVALTTGTQAGWMAILAGLEAAWMLRLGTLRAGPMRIALALIATVLIALAAHWGIIAAHLGGPLGLGIWESALRLGPHLAWTMAGLANGWVELAWLCAGMVAAWRLAR